MPIKATDYDKKTPREHILTRPDTYIGDIEETKETLSQADTIKKLEEELNFYKSLFKERNNSCIFNLKIKKINGKNVWVDRVHDQREYFLKLDEDDEVREWLKPVRCER